MRAVTNLSPTCGTLAWPISSPLSRPRQGAARRGHVALGLELLEPISPGPDSEPCVVVSMTRI